MFAGARPRKMPNTAVHWRKMSNNDEHLRTMTNNDEQRRGSLWGGTLVVQDLCTKYPVASLLKNGTNAKTTINVLDEIFTNFGRPSRYRSDIGPPFNSAAFTSYMENIGVVGDRSYPYRPQSNPVETWMKPLGKLLKIANRNKKAKEKAIRDLLMAYRTTPHPATTVIVGTC